VEFLDQIEDYCQRITEHTEQFQSYRNWRVAVVKRFPYKIVYEIEGETIVVYAVYHDKRNPEKLKSGEMR
jgi:plasmid stabilization system protein ParE